MNTSTTLKIILALFVVGILYYGYLYTTGNLQAPVGNPNGGITSGKLLINGDNAIAATTQKPGSSVFVNVVIMKDPGYVMIHEVNADGSTGAIIGVSQLLPAGQSNGISISLSKEMKDGERYIAMLHKDDGNGTYTASNDAPVTDADGNIVQTQFSVSTDANPVNVQL